MNVKWVPKGKFRCAGTHIKPQFHVEERGASQTKSAARKCTATLQGFARGGAHAAGRIEIFLVGRMQLVEARGPKVPAIVPRNLRSLRSLLGGRDERIKKTLSVRKDAYRKIE